MPGMECAHCRHEAERARQGGSSLAKIGEGKDCFHHEYKRMKRMARINLIGDAKVLHFAFAKVDKDAEM